MLGELAKVCIILVKYFNSLIKCNFYPGIVEILFTRHCEKYLSIAVCLRLRCCRDCVGELRGCCCRDCKTAPRLRPVLFQHERYKKWHLYRDSEVREEISTLN